MAAISSGVPSASKSALVQHSDPVGEVEDHAHVVLDQHDREVVVAMQAPDELRGLVGLLFAHARGRLVQQQQARPQRQRHRDLGSALVAVREFADQPVGLGGETGELERRLDLTTYISRSRLG